MKKTLAIFFVFGAFLLGCNQDSSISTKSKLDTDKEKYSYAVGMNMGRSVNQMNADLDYAIFLRGLNDQITNSAMLMDEAEARAAMENLMQIMQAKQQQENSVKAAAALIQQQEFLAKNKNETGIQTSASGLQYLVLQEGTGVAPVEGDVVVAHYVGTLLDGTEFDNSIKRGSPPSFPLNERVIILGWLEALKLMKTGGKMKIWVPSDLAYGLEGRPPVIPGNSLLVFEIELLEIKPDENAAAAE